MPVQFAGKHFQKVVFFGLLAAVISGKKFGIYMIDSSLGQRL